MCLRCPLSQSSVVSLSLIDFIFACFAYHWSSLTSDNFLSRAFPSVVFHTPVLYHRKWGKLFLFCSESSIQCTWSSLGVVHHTDWVVVWQTAALKSSFMILEGFSVVFSIIACRQPLSHQCLKHKHKSQILPSAKTHYHAKMSYDRFGHLLLIIEISLQSNLKLLSPSPVQELQYYPVCTAFITITVDTTAFQPDTLCHCNRPSEDRNRHGFLLYWTYSFNLSSQ